MNGLTRLNPRKILVLIAMAVCTLGPASAQQTPQPPPARAAPPEPVPEGPGYRVRSLPTDTFKSKEQVSEDVPVTFPADI